MEFQHSWAITLRHIRLWLRDSNLILVSLYWPILDVLIWGFMGKWMQTDQTGSNDYKTLLLVSILLWQTSCRGAIVTVQAFLEEIWAFNLINLFALPLRLIEWIGGVLLFNLIFTAFNVSYFILLIYLVYGIPLLLIFKMFILFGPPLIISGIWVGFVTLPFITAFGKRMSELCWMMPWFFAPLCGVFYPINVFPYWMQKFSYCLPMTYVFEGMRAYFLQGQNPASYLITAYCMATVYSLISIGIFILSFNRSKTRGLARLSE